MEKLNKATVSVESLVLPTYREPAAEELPMFAENRVHQRTSGDPYPNRIVSAVDREHREDREYVAVRLENDYVSVVVLPELGGRIYSATDKTTGYDFFYKQHVIKPALIGVLGSWISGGVEFNWPFHHRASGYMGCDYTVEEYPDGSVACHLSEHDPIDRMKGAFSIILRPDSKYIETRMRLHNRTASPHSFLWWENAAVPVNESYQIFFPQDVTYVNFHYLKSRTSFPVAGGCVFNGIPMKEARDISMHKNTREATSYFASASDYDFFGGYDHGKGCGVVHVADHHLSPGKKMFTWAYGQLSRSWEKALTDEDGQYAELMAGSYSDNQPDFAWLAPYETKEFSQYWYPISEIGTPTFANLNCALKLTRGGDGAELVLQSCRPLKGVRVQICDGERELLSATCELTPDSCQKFNTGALPAFVSVRVLDADGEVLAEYTEREYDTHSMPDPITDMPVAESMRSAQQLYLAGVHVEQYRDPAVKPDAYWSRALALDPDHLPSLMAMARYSLDTLSPDAAYGYATRALKLLTAYNARTESGECYYLLGRIHEARGEYKSAYDSYYKAAWAADLVSAAMTRIAVLDLRRKDYAEARRHALWALDYGRKNSLATAALIYALRGLGSEEDARRVGEEYLALDPLDHSVRLATGAGLDFGALISDPAGTCLDLAGELNDMGRYDDGDALLRGLIEARPECATKAVYYVLSYLARRLGREVDTLVAAAESAELGRAYPSRAVEMAALTPLAKEGRSEAAMLLGCILYHARHYNEAAELFRAAQDGSYIARRNLAVALFSHLGKGEEALKIMTSLCEERPSDGQILYETVVLMNKLGSPAEDKLALLLAHTIDRDDLAVELVKAYNQAGQHGMAMDTLLSHSFVPCEGGEHSIADQYIFAHLSLGLQAMKEGKHEEARAILVKGQTIPDSLGAGIWNHCKLIPLKYREALCLDALGRSNEAESIYRYIADTEIEYFSNMHLPELPYYRALCYDRLGDGFSARKLITHYRRLWDSMAGVTDNGFFATTPFFISFTDSPARLRSAKQLYLSALIERYLGNDETADAMMRESYIKNTDNLFALVM